MRFRFPIAILAGLTLLAPARGRAGPPYVTDDPEPVEYRHWEVYVASQVHVAAHDLDGAAPLVEANYGAAPDLHLHVGASLAFARADGPTRFGFGDVEVGAKVRLVHEDGPVPTVAIFPMLSIPTGRASNGLGNGAAQLFLPLWIQKRWGAWQTNAGAAYGVNWARDGKDWWFAGWQAQYAFPSVATLGAELFYTTSHDRGGDPDFAFNVGLVLDLADSHHLLLSAGRDFVGPTRFQGYLAYQFTVGRSEEPFAP